MCVSRRHTGFVILTSVLCLYTQARDDLVLAVVVAILMGSMQ